MARSDLDDLGDVSEEEVRALQPPDDYDSPPVSREQRFLDVQVERDNRKRAEYVERERERIRQKEQRAADQVERERERIRQRELKEQARSDADKERERQREIREKERREEQKIKEDKRQWEEMDRAVAADNKRLKAEEKRLESRKKREEERKKKEAERTWSDTERGMAAENRQNRKEKEQFEKELSEAEKDAKKRRLSFDKPYPGESKKDYLKRQFSPEMLNKSEVKETTFAIAKTFGNVILGGVKKVISDGHGRSGRRATLAYRRENREYNSEARRMRSQVASPGIFNSKLMFGENKIPERTRYAGKEAFGNVDPLAQFSMVGLGMKVAPQGMRVVQERHRQPQPRLESPKRLVKKGKKDPLKDFNDMIGGF